MAVAGLCVPLAVPLGAQWLNYPSPGIPRTRDGKPNLSAPAPRAADGKPDLSGVWRTKQASYLFYVTSDLKPAEILPQAAALYKQQADNFRKDSDGIACLPPGPKAGISGGGFPAKIVQTPGLVVILYEYQTIFRQIFTDGRKHPADPSPTWLGYSVGTWDGDTLVVDTVGFNNLSWLDARGHGHSEDMRVEERFHRRDFGHLEVAVTIADPKMFTKPFTINFVEQLLPDTDVFEHICYENEKDAAHLPGKAGK